MIRKLAVIPALGLLLTCGSPTAPTFVCPPGWTCAPTPTTLPPAASPAATCIPRFTGQKVKVDPTSLQALDDAIVAEVASRPDLFYPDGGVIGWPQDWESQWKIASGIFDDLIRRLAPRCAYVDGDGLTVQRDDKDWDNYHVFNFSGSINKALARGYQATLISEKP